MRLRNEIRDEAHSKKGAKKFKKPFSQFSLALMRFRVLSWALFRDKIQGLGKGKLGVDF
jgi:hypothetical protein